MNNLDTMTQVERVAQVARVAQKNNQKGLASVVIIVIAAIVIVVPLVSITTLHLIATNKIKVTNTNLRNLAVEVSSKIPFLPKTPEMILKKSIESHKNVSTGHVDASIASSESAPEITHVLGTNRLDVSITGPFDLTDQKNPKLNFKIKLSNEIDADLILLGNKMYFKVNKVPAMISAYLGNNLSKVVNKWIFKDVTPLETEARKSLAEEQDFDKAYEENIQRFFTEEALTKVDMTDETIDGKQTYKIHLKLDENLLKELANNYKNKDENIEMSLKVIKSMDITIWIEHDTYLMNKAIVKTLIDSNLMYGGSSYPDATGLRVAQKNMEIVTAIKFNKLGEKVTISEPTEFMTLEEVYKILSGISNFQEPGI